MVYVNVDAAFRLSGVPFAELGFDTEAALKAWLTTYILPGIESFIANRTETWTAANVPAAVALAANMATSNVLVYYRVNNMGGLIKVGEFKLQAPLVDIFTPEILKMIDAFQPSPDPTQIYQSSDYKTQALKDTWEEP
jgi:hypothetical protein